MSLKIDRGMIIERTKKMKIIIIWILQWNTYNGKRRKLIYIGGYRRSFTMVLQSMWLEITTSMNDNYLI